MQIFGKEHTEYKVSFVAVAAVMLLILVYPVGSVLMQSFYKDGAATLANYADVLGQWRFWRIMGNSLWVSVWAALISTTLAFFCAYGLQFSRLTSRTKTLVQIVILLPLFLPSITYGFAVIYSFGRQGLVSQLIAPPPFSIYGFWGLLIAFVIYTLPPAFLILNNALTYVDKHFITVSRLMGDNPFQTFYVTALRPVVGALASAFILCFFLCFTDFGIPASIAGQYEVVAIELYSIMMGAIPDFARGSVVAVVMLLPALASVALLRYCERFNFRYQNIRKVELTVNKTRDIGFSVYFMVIGCMLLSVFAVMFIVPFVKSWPYQIEFTTDTLVRMLGDASVLRVYGNSLLVAFVSAGVGTALCFAAGMINARSRLNGWCRTLMDVFAMASNTIPGMVIGVGFLFAFAGTPLMNTFAIVVLANLVHFFTTPYLLSQSVFSKMNASWETTGLLMGDTWLQTLRRVVIPNAMATVVQMFGYLFINAMVTISAVVFLCGAHTMLLTTKIKELQYFEKFDEIFVLSLMIFFTNVAAKLLLDALARRLSVVRSQKK